MRFINSFKDMGVRPSSAEAAKWFSRAAEQGHAPSQFKLGMYYFKIGCGECYHEITSDECSKENPIEVTSSSSIEEAEKWFHRSAGQDYTPAKLFLGYMYKRDRVREGKQVVPENNAKAAKWFRSAAEQGCAQAKDRICEDARGGCPDAQYNFGLMHHKGRGVKKDDDEAMTWFHQAAKSGNHIDAQYELALMYHDGYYDKNGELRRCPVSAVEWLRKAANQDHAGARYRLALIYRDGYHDKNSDLRRCPASAVEWLRKAADQGHADAQYELALMLYDDAEAVKWCYNSARQYHEKALELLEKMAEDGDHTEQSDVQCYLGQLYQQGCGIRKDESKAVKWFSQAAEQGHAGAQNLLGIVYRDGYRDEKGDMQQDWAKAKELFRQAAEEKQHADAQFNLWGMMPMPSAKKIEQQLDNVEDAEIKNPLRILQRCARRGHPDAQYNLGSIYEKIAYNIIDDANYTQPEESQRNEMSENKRKMFERIYEKEQYWFLKAYDQEHSKAEGKIMNYLTEPLIVMEDDFDDSENIEDVVVSEGQYLLCEKSARDEPKSITKYVTRIYKEAEQGHSDSQFKLGNYLLPNQDESVQDRGETYIRVKDISKYTAYKAIEYFRQAAEQNHPDAQYKLGDNLPRDESNLLVYGMKFTDDAIEYFRQAAEQGHSDARFRIGCIEESRLRYITECKAIERCKTIATRSRSSLKQDDEKKIIDEVVKYSKETAISRFDIYGLTERVAKYTKCCAPEEKERYEDENGAIHFYPDEVDFLIHEADDSEQAFIDYMKDAVTGYMKNLFVEDVWCRAGTWFRLAAEQGHASAQFYLACMYKNIEGYPPPNCDSIVSDKDNADAMKWFRRAAEQGNKSALERLEDGKNSCPDSMFNLGCMYQLGRGVKKDETEAEKLLLQAAEQKHPDAQNRLGIMYRDGRGETRKDCTKAVWWFRQAADQGHAPAQFNLGRMYEQGRGVEQDYVEREKWLRRAGENYPEVQNDLGVMYRDGYRDEKGDKQPNWAEAKTWFRRAAEQGHPDAQYNLAILYRDGCRDAKGSMPQDWTKAKTWFRRAAEQGHPDAQCNLAAMYRDEKGNAQDWAEAEKWFRRAAEQGHPDAQFNIGRMCKQGRAVKRDDDEAMKWLQKADHQGHTGAKRELELVRSLRRDDQRREIDRSISGGENTEEMSRRSRLYSDEDISKLEAEGWPIPTRQPPNDTRQS